MNIRGYLRACLSPSSTDQYHRALGGAGVRTQRGQTRLPDASLQDGYIHRLRAEGSSRPWRVMSARKVALYRPCVRLRPSRRRSAPCRVSTSESISASIMLVRSSSFRASIVRTRVVVLPLPGEDMRLGGRGPLSFQLPRGGNPPPLLLSANTLCFYLDCPEHGFAPFDVFNKISGSSA